MEMAEYLNKKADSSIMVYSLAISYEKKKAIIEKVHEINEQGNAYNIFGLIFKRSMRSNILFCSQFVYKMLKMVDVQYFEKNVLHKNGKYGIKYKYMF
jgi:hypothetical protein